MTATSREYKMKVITSIKGQIREYTLKAKRSHQYDLKVFLADNKNTLFQLLQKILQSLKSTSNFKSP